MKRNVEREVIYSRLYNIYVSFLAGSKDFFNKPRRIVTFENIKTDRVVAYKLMKLEFENTSHIVSPVLRDFYGS